MSKRVLIVSLGSIGRRHLANVRQLEPKAEIAVWHQHTPPKAASDDPIAANRIVFSLEEALSFEPEMAILASPASQHIQTALKLAHAGVHLFIEKPISHTMEQVDELIAVCRLRSLVLMVGYNLRFYRPLQVLKSCLEEGRIGRLLSIRAEVGQYLPDWRPNTDYRKSVSARQDLGGGVILELSHEIDYVRWLAGEVKSISAELGHLSDLEIDTEDVAEILLRFKDGAVGNIHLNMIQQPMTRSCRLVGTEGTLIWDGVSHTVSLFSTATQSWSEPHPSEGRDRNTMFLEELAHFFGCVCENKIPCVSGEEGRRILQLALAAKESAALQHTIAV